VFRKVTSCGLLRRASGPVPLDASGYPGRLSDEPRMKDLLTFAVEAHGGLERWGRLETLSAELTVGGAIWCCLSRSSTAWVPPSVVMPPGGSLGLRDRFREEETLGQRETPGVSRL